MDAHLAAIANLIIAFATLIGSVGALVVSIHNGSKLNTVKSIVNGNTQQLLNKIPDNDSTKEAQANATA